MIGSGIFTIIMMANCRSLKAANITCRRDHPPPYTQIIDNGVVYKAIYFSSGSLSMVEMRDGTRLKIGGAWEGSTYHYVCTEVSDPKGNKTTYSYDTFGGKLRIHEITDTAYRVFHFVYNSSGDLTEVQQHVDDNTAWKTIISRNGDVFTDVLGRTSSYEYVTYNGQNYISCISYSTGVKLQYDYVNDIVMYNTGAYQYRVSQFKIFKPGDWNTAYRTVTYSQDVTNRVVNVNDGLKVMKYYLSSEDPGPKGYTEKEETYSVANGTADHLLKQVTTTYIAVGTDNAYARPQTVTTKLVQSNYNLGQAVTYEYQYDNWGNVTYSKDPEGHITRTAYSNTDSNPNLSSFNSTDNCTYRDYKYTDPYSAQIHDRVLTTATIVKDPVHTNNDLLQQTQYKYDSEGNQLEESVLKTLGSIPSTDTYLVTSYTYDNYGNMTSQTDPNGKVLNFEYFFGYKYAYLTWIYQSYNGSNVFLSSYEYDFDLGKPVTVKDPRGMQNDTHHFDYTYDGAGRVTSETLDTASDDQDVEVSKVITYHDLPNDPVADNIVEVKYGNATKGWREAKFTYDPIFAKVAKVERKLNENWVTLKTNTYDTNGRLVTTTDNLNHTNSFDYDALDRQAKIIYQDNTETDFVWNDHTLTTTDQKGNTKSEYYDKLERLIRTEEHPATGTTYTTLYTYDSAGKLVKTILPNNNNEIKNTYNWLGQLIRTDYPDNTYETYTYDDAGNLTSKLDIKGETKSMVYEFFAGYRLTQVTEPGASGRVISYTYDRNNNPLIISVPNVATYTYDNYDERNRPRNFSANLDSTTINLSYTYDTFGHTTSITYPGWNQAVTSEYDELDRLMGVSGTLHGSAYPFVSNCVYDDDNKLTVMTYGNGIINGYAYNNMDRITGITAGTGGSILNLSYSYDNLGNITQLNNDYYGYDGLNQLIWAGDQTSQLSRGSNGTVWTYDPAGNMAQKQLYSDGQSRRNIGFTNNSANNRLNAMGNWSFTYNNAGACTQKFRTGLTWDYLYDSESRLTEVKRNNTTVETYAYDGNGFRYKTVKGGVTTYYIYNGGVDPIAEYTPANSAYKYYIYAGSQLIGDVVKNSQGETVTYYHKDHEGSTRATTNESGTVVTRSACEPFGTVKPVKSDTFSSNSLSNWMVNDGNGADFIAENNAVTIVHTTVDYSGDYMVGQFDSLANVVIEFDAKIGLVNNDSASLDVESNGFNLAFIGGCLYYRKDGSDTWHLVSDFVADNIPFGQWNHFKLVLTASRVEIYINDVLEYSQTGTFSAKNYLGFRDYGLCLGTVTSYVDNITVAACYGDYDYTGKKISQDTGLVYFGGRWYDPEIGRFITQDPAKDGVNWYVYCENNPINVIDPNGYSGTLTIYSYGGAGADPYCGVIVYGYHSWISYTPDNWGSGTYYYCTWNGYGVRDNASYDIDNSTNPDVSTRSMYINDDQEFSMLTEIDSYRDQGVGAWSAWNACSGFASDVWYAGTGENLEDRNWGGNGYSEPNVLADSIDAANVNDTGNTDSSGSTNDTNSTTSGSESVICVELFRQGLMDKDIFTIDEKFADNLKENFPYVVIGYQFWAKPVVGYMKKSRAFTNFVYTIAKPWTYEMAHLMDKSRKGNIVGGIIMFLGVPLCWLIGMVLVNIYIKTILFCLLIIFICLKLRQLLKNTFFTVKKL
ncbi:MAG TPA: RHS repeat-associated core domain-containing protein [Bacillota bacterium]|nr:RHS repeat-associated core domain-containing protein [Bacillota bacterium]